MSSRPALSRDISGDSTELEYLKQASDDVFVMDSVTIGMPRTSMSTSNLERMLSTPSTPSHEEVDSSPRVPPSQADTTISSPEGVTSSRGLSPLTVLGFSSERKGDIRRAHSSASFEKYKYDKLRSKGQSSAPGTPVLSGWSTPQRLPSGGGMAHPARLRHVSGLAMMSSMSTIRTMSRSSIAGEEGKQFLNFLV